VHRDRLDAQFAAGALYAQRDLTAVRYEDFFEHGKLCARRLEKTRPGGSMLN
jgi:hypothetical protein